MPDLTKEIEQALDVLDRTYKKSCNKKKIILDKAPRKRKFVKLCHSLYGSDPEICLFVPNRKTGVEYKKTTDELIDFCVDHYTGILEKHKVKGITTVMPLKQLKSEYGTYELRRKLVQRFDLFLCKNSLLYNSRFLTSLGKTFRIANKEPLGVPFPKDDVDYDPEFQENIKRAILTSSFYITRFSDNYSIPFGCLSNTKTELKENLEMVLHQVFNENIIPGGIRNIRTMYVWPSQSKPVPLYFSPDIPVDLKKPCVKSKRKRVRGINGELSTQPHKKVFVTPSGEVFITETGKDLNKPEVSDFEDDDSFMDESDNDVHGVDDDNNDKKDNYKSKDAANEKEEESESEGDEAIEEKEAKLLEKNRRSFQSEVHLKGKNLQNEKKRTEKDLELNQSTKRKSRQRGASDGNNEKVNLTEGNKGKSIKINKTERKMLIKQEKFSKKRKIKQKKI